MLKRRPVSLVGLCGVLALWAALSACGSGGETADGRSTSGAGPEVTVTVSAASSLTEVFEAIAKDFEVANPEVRLRLNFGSSGRLADQIAAGAPADVAAFADAAPMARLAEEGLLDGSHEVFARNELVIVTKPQNPAGIDSLADLEGAGIVSLCVQTAPCGSLADQALSAAGVTVPESSVTRGQDVKATLAAVSEGDAVAGIVYATDARAAGGAVDAVTIPDRDNVVAEYSAAVIAADNGSGHGARAAARAFVDYLSAPEAQAVLSRAGFLAP